MQQKKAFGYKYSLVRVRHFERSHQANSAPMDGGFKTLERVAPIRIVRINATMN